MTAIATRAPTIPRVDSLNVMLLGLSAIAAVMLPFELFLFSYAVLGPLHYLTEISWLHDKKYYATGRYDVVWLVVLSLVLTIFYFISLESGGLAWIRDNIGFDRYQRIQAHLIFVGLASGAIFAFVKSFGMKLIGIGVAIMLTALSSRMVIVFGVFVPTLVHVFVFTSIFMLYGALKSGSRIGYLTVALHLLIPLLLFFVGPADSIVETTQYGREAYQEGFLGLNQEFFNFDYFSSRSYESVTNELGKGRTELTDADLIFDSSEGVALMRFIAFAYTYHYLNWFSKTAVIGWHAVPKPRFLVVVIAAIASVALYAIDYSLGFKWLFLLSFMHVMLEFPLNWVSFTGIFREVRARVVPAAA